MSNQQKQKETPDTTAALSQNGPAITSANELAEANAQLQRQVDRLRRYSQALLNLSSQDDVTAGLDERLTQMTQVTGRTLNVERVGVWFYDEDRTKITCVKLYEYGSDRHSNGLELYAADYPIYFQALEEEATIDASDAQDDPRTSEFTEDYLQPLDITALLDVPIQQDEAVIGLISLEHVGSQRHWDIEDKNFAKAVADQIALIIERHKRTNVEARLAESQRTLTALMNHLPGMAYRYRNDENWTMDFVSSGVTTLTGYQADDLIDNRILAYADLIHADDQERVWQHVQRQLARKKPFTITYRLYTADGQEKSVWEQGQGVYDATGELLAVEGFITDITRRLQREEALQRSQELLQNVVNNAPIIIFALDRDGNFTLSDGKQLASLGLKPGQVVGMSAFDVYGEVPEIVDNIKQTLAGEPTKYEAAVGEMAFETWLEPIYNDKDEMDGLVGVAIDVTDRQHAATTLETRLRYERGLSLASQALLATEDETAVSQTLAYLREAADACRAYYFQVIDDREIGLYARQLYEDCAPGITPQIDNPDMQQFLFAEFGFGRWVDLLSQGQVINQAVADMPDAERQVLAEQDIQSILVLPVIINNEWQGIIGFDDTKGSDDWPTEDVDLLQTATGMIGAYIERHQAGQMLQDRLGYEHGLSLAAQTLLTATTDDALTEALNYLREATGTSRAYLFENFVDAELGLCMRQLYEACAPDVEPQIDLPELQRLPYEQTGLSRWIEVLGQGELINSAIPDLPPPEDEVMVSFGLKAILLLPIFIGKQWYGFIGFDNVETAQAWRDEDAQLLLTGARLFGAFMERRQLAEEVELSLERRSTQVRVSTLVAQEIAKTRDLPELYERIVTLIKEEFDYYHVQLLRYDPALDNIGLVVGYGEVGKEMLALNHSLPMDVGVIGKAASTGESVLLADVRQDPNWKPNPLLPDTKSELAVPIRAGTEILGVIDIQSNSLGGLSATDQILLDGLSGQLATAIESTRLRQEMEDRLRELDTLQRYMSRSGWDQYQTQQKEHLGYSFHRGDITRLREMPYTDTNGRSNQPDRDGQAILTPLSVRGETIGLLGIEADDERPLTPDEEELIRAISGQVAEALEAARLFEQTQISLAEQERLSSELATVAEVSTAASTILEAEALLQAAVDLAQTSFNLTHAHIYLFDRENKVLELQAGAGDSGRLMTLEGRTIDLDAPSLIAKAAREREGSFSNNVQKTLEFLPHPLLGDTRSEMAIPMIVGRSLIGVLDLLSDEADRFSEQDMGIFNTLASQVAVAVQNAQLYAEQVATAEELRKVDQLKSEFLASMSHELRTPLNSIIGFADVLLEGIDGELNERMEEDVRLIRDSGSHLRALIGDILDMSKIEAGMMEIRHEALEITQLAEDVIATAMPLAQEKNLYVKLDVMEEVPTIYADHTRIRQVLWNIVGNAIKFTQEGGVTMTVGQTQEDDLLVSVSDTGVGIRPNDLSVVFEQFRQVGGELNTSSSGGTGLGLPISKKLIELHGGTIWVESTVGEGTTFCFTLPIGLPPANSTKPKTGPLSVLG